MKFKLKEDTVTVRDETMTVRELTHKERLNWVKITQEDRYRGPSVLVQYGCVDPTFTEEEADALPSDVVDAIGSKIMELSSLSKTKKESDEKKSDAGATL